MNLFRVRIPVFVFIMVGLGLAFGLGLGINKLTHPSANHPWVPTVQTQTVQLKPESSDESWRQLEQSADGHRIRLTIAYQNGSLARITYSPANRVATYAAYADGISKVPTYLARYDAEGKRIVYYELHASDGSVSIFASTADGGWTLQSLRSNGSLNSLVVTLNDGSQKRITYGDDGQTVTAEALVKPEAHDVTVGDWNNPSGMLSPAAQSAAASTNSAAPAAAVQPDPSAAATAGSTSATAPTTSGDGGTAVPATAADGTTPSDQSTPTPAPDPKPKLRIHMVGVKVVSWDYLDADGNVLHSGVIDADQGITITYKQSSGSGIAFQQHWRFLGEDWSRRYYALDRVVQYEDDGKGVYRQLFLGTDEHTVRESRLFHDDGTPIQVRYYDENGKEVYYDDFDSDGKFVGTQTPPTWYSSSEMVDDSLLAVPSSDGTNPLYRLRGHAFAPLPMQPPPAVDPLFISQ